MSEDRSGLLAFLSHPIVYYCFQTLMGAHSSRKEFVENKIQPFQGMKILDVGCGPADMFPYLPNNIEYFGIDISEKYILHAKKKYGGKGTFLQQSTDSSDSSQLPLFDVVLALGLLHHLDDQQAVKMLRFTYDVLKPGGKLLTVDPCLDPNQNFIARFLISRDRGQNVREKDSYRALMSEKYSDVSVRIHNKRWIPYTLCYMQGNK